MLLSDGQLMGPCLSIVTYPVNAENMQAGQLRTTPITVRWPSGATLTVPGLTVSLSAGYALQYTFVRPEGVPGAEMDYQVGADAEARVAAQQGQMGFAIGQLIGQALAK